MSRRTLRPGALAALLALMVSLLDARALAQALGVAERAKALATQGTARYQIGLFEEALRLYEEAYRLHPVPALIFNIAQCHRQLKHYERAIFLYRSFLRASPDAPNRQAVEEIVAELERLVREQQKARTAPPERNLNVDGGTSTGSSTAAVATRSATVDDDATATPWYKKWWVWTLVGVAVVGGAVAGGVAGTRGGAQPVPEGTLGNMSFSFGGQR